VLDRLSGGQQAGVQRVRPSEILHDLLAFVDNADDGFAGLAAGRLADKLEYLVEALDLTFGFAAMVSNACRSSSYWAALAIFGKARRICLSAK
jgi:hypothetical protein